MKQAGSPIETVAVIGAGLIGASWASLFLSKGLRVLASDPSLGAEDRLRHFVDQALADLRKLNPEADITASKLDFTMNPRHAAADADFIQESAPERLELKRDLLATLDSVAKPSVIIASSTSSLRASDMQTDCRTPERVVVGHPFNPPHLIPLVEVVGGKLTSAETIETAIAFYQDLGKSPIRVQQEVVGHVANRLTAALWREAVHLVAEGIATVEDVDNAIVNGPGLRWAVFGPHLLYHLAGGAGGLAAYLEHLGPTQEARWKTLGSPQLTESVKAQLIDGVEAAASERSIAELARDRDEVLIEILSARAQRQQVGPED